MQAVILASKKRFTLETQSDPVEFASWLLNALHNDLTSGKLKKQSIITQCFQVRDEGGGRAGGARGSQKLEPRDAMSAEGAAACRRLCCGCVATLLNCAQACFVLPTIRSPVGW